MVDGGAGLGWGGRGGGRMAGHPPPIPQIFGR